MIKININGKEWNYYETDLDHLQEEYKKQGGAEQGEILGFTNTKSRTIMVSNNIHKEEIKETLRHELMHAYLCSVGISIETITEEQLCNIYAAAVDTIEKIVIKLYQ